MELNLPQASLRFEVSQDGVRRVFDRLRCKWIVATPEEIVRQNFTAWLISHFGFPPSLMANEVGIKMNGTSKRCDTVLFRPDGKPLVIVEYKAPNVNISQDVFDQIVRYNLQLKADYLVVSNGLNHYCCKIDYNNETYHFIPRLPDYKELV